MRHACNVSRVQVYGEKDADGFYWGEAGPRQGFVPCNMVSEVQVGGAVLLRDNLILLAGEGAGCDTRQVSPRHCITRVLTTYSCQLGDICCILRTLELSTDNSNI